MDTKRKKFALIGVLTLVTVITFAYLFMRDVHKEEIERVITSKGGIVVDIEEIFSKENTPFDKSGKGNYLYKITYQRDGDILIAWYRAINNPKIHEKTKNAYEEKWIFEGP
jgi:hypothetical protein